MLVLALKGGCNLYASLGQLRPYYVTPNINNLLYHIFVYKLKNSNIIKSDQNIDAEAKKKES